MNVRKYLLSCAAIALSGGSLCLLGATAHAQPTDDFLTPPVVENVTEIVILLVVVYLFVDLLLDLLLYR